MRKLFPLCWISTSSSSIFWSVLKTFITTQLIQYNNFCIPREYIYINNHLILSSSLLFILRFHSHACSSDSCQKKLANLANFWCIIYLLPYKFLHRTIQGLALLWVWRQRRVINQPKENKQPLWDNDPHKVLKKFCAWKNASDTGKGRSRELLFQLLVKFLKC